MKRRFIVTLEVPDGVSLADMTSYIKDAVVAIPGYYQKEEPIFNLDRESVKVVRGKTSAQLARDRRLKRK